MSNNCFTPNCYSSVIPSGTDVYINKNDCEVKADITVNRIKNIVVWGYVRDCKGYPIEEAFVNLLKYENSYNNELKAISHTYTDCNGFYQFDLPSTCEGRYRVNVNKCSYGNERNNCDFQSKQDSRCSLNSNCQTKPDECCISKRNSVCYY